MTIRLTDLTPLQIRMLIKLDDGFEHEDSVGREIGSLTSRELRTVDSLVRKGLVEMRPGHEFQFWLRLTEAGRRVRENGVA